MIKSFFSVGKDRKILKDGIGVQTLFYNICSFIGIKGEVGDG